MSEVAALVRDVRTRNGWSVDDVARQAGKEKGGRRAISRQTVNAVEHKGMPTLVPSTIIAIARGLQIPPYQVALAALADAGIVIPFDTAKNPEEAIAQDRTLTAKAREILRAALAADRANG